MTRLIKAKNEAQKDSVALDLEQSLSDIIVNKAINWEQNRSPHEESELVLAIHNLLDARRNGFNK
jgi:hypothetical protein